MESRAHRRLVARRACACVALAAWLAVIPLHAASAANVPPAKWIAKVCKVVQDWQSTVTDQQEAAVDGISDLAGDLVALRDHLTASLDENIATTEAAMASIRKAGTPSSENGGKIAAKFVAGFQAAGDAFAATRADAAALPTDDPQAFSDAAFDLASNDAGTEITAAFSAINGLDTRQTLSKAFLKVKACKKLSGG